MVGLAADDVEEAAAGWPGRRAFLADSLSPLLSGAGRLLLECATTVGRSTCSQNEDIYQSS